MPVCVFDRSRMTVDSLQARRGSLTVYRFRGELLPGFDPICGPVCLARYVVDWARGEPIPKELL